MKVKFHNILVLLLAVIVFFVGAGVTVVDLCCSKCVDKVLSMNPHIADCSMDEPAEETPSCCSEENQPATHSEDASACMNGSDKAYAGKCCDAKRISVDIDRSVFQPKLLHSMVWTMVPSFISQVLLSSDNNESVVIAEARDPIPIPPRNYLTLIRVLII